MIGRQFTGNDPRIMIQLERDPPSYLPGETLRGEYRLDHGLAAQTERINISVLWYTEGKGTESTAIQYEEDIPNAKHPRFDPYSTGRFETTLPPSPLSYDGQIVKIHWCVRVEVFLADKQQRIGEAYFQLGQVSSFAWREQETTR